jgi:hypothetical protein
MREMTKKQVDGEEEEALLLASAGIQPNVKQKLLLYKVGLLRQKSS